MVLGGMMGGAAGVGLAGILLVLIIAHVGLPFENSDQNLILIIIWGALSGLVLSVGLNFNFFRNQTVKINWFLKIAIATLGGVVAGALFSWLIAGTFSGGVIFGAIFNFWIAFWILIFKKRFIQKEGPIINIIKFSMGGLTGGGLCRCD